MSADTTDLSYWLNWRFLVCAVWVLSAMVTASVLIWKYEGPNSRRREPPEFQEHTCGTMYADESWRPCLEDIHPAWLLAYRIISFLILLGLLVANSIVDGGSIFYYYTQWTFALVTFYFGLGTVMSIYGCHQYLINKNDDDKNLDAERGIYVALANDGNGDVRGTIKNYCFREEDTTREIAGIWGYVFQIIYQTNAGAVVITDIVFWLIIAPFRSMNDCDLNPLLISMHSVNAVFILGDAALNCLRFPWFRISYFLLWTGIFVIFQWIIHACISFWWPYPFLDLSSPRAPLWYLIVAALHIPCYAIFRLFLKLKHLLLSRWFPQSYHYME